MESKLPFGKYPKATYRLFQNGALMYFFTTTIHSEDECIEIMKVKAEALRERFYCIIKTADGKKTMIFQVRSCAKKLSDKCRKFIHKNYMKYTDKEIGEMFNANRNAVNGYRYKNNLHKHKHLSK